MRRECKSESDSTQLGVTQSLPKYLNFSLHVKGQWEKECRDFIYLFHPVMVCLLACTATLTDTALLWQR